MKKFKPKFLLETVMILFMAAILIAVWVQVLSRFFLPTVPSWTGEEAVTFLMIWMTTMGAAVSMSRGSHIAVDIIFQVVSDRVSIWIKRVIYLIESVFLGYYSYIGTIYVWNNRGMSTPRLGIPYWILQGAIPVSMAVMFLYAVYYLITSFRKGGNNE